MTYLLIALAVITGLPVLFIILVIFILPYAMMRAEEKERGEKL